MKTLLKMKYAFLKLRTTGRIRSKLEESARELMRSRYAVTVESIVLLLLL